MKSDKICEIWFQGEYWELNFKNAETEEQIKFVSANSFDNVIEVLKFYKNYLKEASQQTDSANTETNEPIKAGNTKLCGKCYKLGNHCECS